VESLWAVAGTTNALEAEWEFRFWSHGGTLTLLSLERTEQGDEFVAPVREGVPLPKSTNKRLTPRAALSG
jgi:hypothetical protein